MIWSERAGNSGRRHPAGCVMRMIGGSDHDQGRQNQTGQHQGSGPDWGGTTHQNGCFHGTRTFSARSRPRAGLAKRM
ncbi:Hypothetical protein GbCGDNIH2_5035 [Granulibacter bethesdensis]|nr:Hypothetical protein GbCGDNIH2_5035 [Granulibacter bethesdensis]APH53114.1 Hypothetical protein GbCGDNIH5_5035 [Granulibacter bethesdensis]